MKGQEKKQITGKIAQVDGLFCLMVWHPNIAGLKSVLALRGVLHLLAAPDMHLPRHEKARLTIG